MRRGLLWILFALALVLGSLVACSPQATGESEPEATPVRTVEVTREVTVERTVPVASEGSELEAEPGPSILPGLASAGEADISRTVGETATLDDGNSVTVLDVRSRLAARETVYETREGFEFFVIEAEVCVSGAAGEPAYFTPRDFSVRVTQTVRRVASIPTKLPALRGSRVEPGDCNRGFITFQLREGEEPQAVMFEDTSSVEWQLEQD